MPRFVKELLYGGALFVVISVITLVIALTSRETLWVQALAGLVWLIIPCISAIWVLPTSSPTAFRSSGDDMSMSFTAMGYVVSWTVSLLSLGIAAALG